MADELREHLVYMSELGVHEVDAAVPMVPHREASTSVGKIDERVPASEIPEILSSKFKTNTEETPRMAPARGKRDLLGGTKLSDVTVPAESKRIAPKQEHRKEEPDPPAQEEEMESVESTLQNDSLETIRAEIGSDCSRCQLCEERTQVVNSVGSAKAQLMVIGEAPGADEDLKGEPFVGRAGKLLTKILESIGFERSDVFIGNINRCRPPQNRQPTLEESAMCKPFLLREIEVVNPKVIVVLGNTATKNLLETTTGITKLRGNFVEKFGVKVMPTFHPAYLLRDPRKKREVWEDMKKIRDFLESSND
ncbi:MAG: uracil-DNA glycosylase [Pyrinomonadaceae bacterium]|nr:uracil-DNA glycosylase [Pyrinomonadaceae bacterium]